MAVNGTRLNDRIQELGRIGATSQRGITRMSLTPEYMEAQGLVIRWMREAGLETTVDSVGNLIGRRPGTDPDTGALAIGSHIDTVINGGRYDGAAGVLGGIEVAQTLDEMDEELVHPFEVISFVEEESTRWGASLVGSRAMLGMVDPEDVLQLEDRNGITMAEGMRQVGLDPDQFEKAIRDPAEIEAYLEMHVEQGAVLDELDLPVGVVTGIAGPLFLHLRLVGRTDHAGATPMHLRHDALAGAADIVLSAERIAKETASTCVATVGRLKVSPGSVNAIPGEVFMTFDIRDIYAENRDAAEQSIEAAINRVAEERGLTYELADVSRIAPVLLPERMVSTISNACEEVEVPVHKIPSGAGHDAQIVAKVTDVGMVFLRSKDGVSHAPEEFTKPEDITLGTEVLYESVLALDRSQS